MKIAATHLNEAELDSCLIGDASAASATHLASCASCTAALAELEAPLASFRAVTLAWSERRSATLPLDNLAAARRRAASSWRQRVAVSAGLAAAMAVGIAVPLLQHPKASDTQTAQSTAAAPEVHPIAAVSIPPVVAAATETASAVPQESPAQQIRRDNQMLRAIDMELDSRAESPAALGLVPVTSVNPGVPSQMQD
jgi:anti-sigma factor RsiW